MYYEKFAKLCELKNVRPGTVSKETGVSTATLTSWKQGKYTPKPDKLAKIAKFFGVSIDYFYGVEKNEHHDEYYVNKETAEMAQAIFEDHYLRTLFDEAKDSAPDDIKMAADFLKRLKGKNPDGHCDLVEVGILLPAS